MPPSPAVSLRFERSECLELDRTLDRVWLETDGRGGYAASTPLLCPMSRFHGLLVAAPEGQSERHLLLSRLEESVDAEGRAFPISMARYGNVISPEGHRFIECVDFDLWPRFAYRIGDVRIWREVLMPRDVSGVLVRYRVEGPREGLTLHLRPFLPCRKASGLTWQNDALDPTVVADEHGFVVRPYDALPPMRITTFGADAELVGDAGWHNGVEHRDDLRRGYDGHEDHWSPGELRIPIAAGQDVLLAVTLGADPVDVSAAWEAECARRPAAGAGDLRTALDRAAQQFLYTATDGRAGIVAGYPWFGEWGRDTFIALPGLTIARGDLEACAAVLRGALPFLCEGRLPNVYGADVAHSDYKAVDAALWFARAVELFDTAGGDREIVETELLPALLSIATAHREAREAGLTCTPDGLLEAGTPDVATTWMDAVVDGRPVTPRDGVQVEVNALWYSLVDHLADLLERTGDDAAADWRTFADGVGAAFVARLWMPDRGRLADRIVDDTLDASVRPNMVLAAALARSPLTPEQRASIVAVSRSELLTPRGLRTLSPRHLAYRGRFAGDVGMRDRAYHQGTVWPWLLGFQVEAELRAAGADPETRSRLRTLLDGFAPHLREHGIGQVSEVFDGDAPHRPGGAFAQAWSVAELLRAYDLLDREEAACAS